MTQKQINTIRQTFQYFYPVAPSPTDRQKHDIVTSILTTEEQLLQSTIDQQAYEHQQNNNPYAEQG